MCVVYTNNQEEPAKLEVEGKEKKNKANHEGRV